MFVTRFQYVHIGACLLLCVLFNISHAKVNHRHLAKQDWIAVSSDNVTVVTNAKPEVGQAMVEQLERFRYFVAYYLGEKGQVITPRLTLYAAGNSNSFDALDLPENIAGVFSRSADGAFAIADASRFSTNPTIQTTGNQVVLHEYVHFISRTISAKYNNPRWYEEGVAEYLATFKELAQGQYFNVGSLDIIGRRARAIVKNPHKPSFELVDVEDLFKSNTTKLSWRDAEKGRKRANPNHTSRFYARAAFTYHYLQSTPELRQQLDHYLELINKGYDIDSSFNIAFKGSSYKDMDKAINRYMTVKNSMRKQLFEVNAPKFQTTVTPLDSDKTYVEIVDRLASISYKPREQRLKMINASQKKYPDNPSLAYRELLLMRSIDIKKYRVRLKQLVAQYPNHAPIQLLQLEAESMKALAYTSAGLDDSDRVNKLRNSVRDILKHDAYNTRAYSLMLKLAADHFEHTPNIVEEACVSGESLRLLTYATRKSLHREIGCRVLQKDIETTTLLLRKLNNAGSYKWANKQHGRFMLDALHLREMALSTPVKVSATRLDYLDGSYYEGDIVDAKPHGKGRIQLANNSHAEGNWQAGMLTTTTDFTASNGYRYVGEWNNGTITGHGTLTLPGGDIAQQEGEFILGLGHGTHTETWRSGMVIKGNIHLGQRYGSFHVTQTDGSHGAVNMVRRYATVETQAGKFYSAAFDKNGAMKPKGTCYSDTSFKLKKCQPSQPVSIL